VENLVKKKDWDGAIAKGTPYEPVASDALTALLVQARRAKFARDKSVILADVKELLYKKNWDGAIAAGAPFEVANDYSLNQLLADARQEKVNLYWAERDRQTAVRISGSTTPQIGMTEEQVIPLCDSRRAHLAHIPLGTAPGLEENNNGPIFPGTYKPALHAKGRDQARA
jgi:hypothetical protein